jgi:hypothetical protein
VRRGLSGVWSVAEVRRATPSLRTRSVASGYQLLLELLGDNQDDLTPVAIETPRGLLVACLRRTGESSTPSIRCRLLGIANGTPLRESSPIEWMPSFWQTSCEPIRNAHRPVPADSELAQAIGVLARAQQDTVWNRQHIVNQLRSLLREYYPAFLEAFQDRRPHGLAHPDARAVLAMTQCGGGSRAIVHNHRHQTPERVRVEADAYCGGWAHCAALTISRSANFCTFSLGVVGNAPTSSSLSGQNCRVTCRVAR